MTNQLDQLGTLTLGSQLRRTTDLLYQQVDAIYRRCGCDFQAAWFPVIYLLSRRSPLTIKDIAAGMRQSHSAASQLVSRLCEEGYVQRAHHLPDRRCSELTLTAHGQALVDRLTPVWQSISEVLDRHTGTTEPVLGTALSSFEAVLNSGVVVDEVTALARSRQADQVTIIDFCADYRDAFLDLNVAWLEKYFRVEPIDQTVLSNPEHIISQGGSILYARYLQSIIGCCALKHHGNGIYELTKMAVDDSYQGLGLGRRLAEAAIARYLELSGKQLYLESSSRLTPALTLYESVGFRHQPRPRPSAYQRSDVYMVYKPD